MKRIAAAIALASVFVLASCSATQAPVALRHPRPTATAVTSANRPTPSVVAAVTPNPCRGNTGGQLVRVSLARQHLWMCQSTHVAHQTPITSGMTGEYTETPTGHYRIQALDTDQTLTLVDGRQYQVRYWIPFDAPLFGFHDASWQTFPFGSARYRRDGSHGCVHMPLQAIAVLYHWAHVGTRVIIEQ